MDHDRLDDQDLRAALAAVDGVEPNDRLAEIRARTRTEDRTRRRARYGAGALVAAAAAVVVGVLVTGLVTGLDDGPGAGDGTVIDPAGSPSEATSEPTSAPGTGEPVTGYYVGPGPDGPDAPEAALYLALVDAPTPLDAVMTTPADPDYRTLWPLGSLVSASDPEAGVVVVTIAASAVARPAGLSDDDAALALQQLAYTVDADADAAAPPEEPDEEPSTIRFQVEGAGATDQVLGTDVGDGLRRAPALEVLSHMSITEPSEGATYPAGTSSFTASGQGNSFEAGGACFLRGDDGFEAGPYLAQMSGFMEPRLFPWELSVDLTAVPPGTYTFSCITDDASAGTEGRGTDTDTRTVIVE